MPLKVGTTQSIISSNIAQLIREGKTRDEAVAIAFAKAGKTRRKKKK